MRLFFLLQLLAMDVVDAESLDDDAVGEDDIKERDGCETLKMTRTLCTLRQCGVPTLEMYG